MKILQHIFYVFLFSLDILLNTSLAISDMKFPMDVGEWKISQEAGISPGANGKCPSYHCGDGFFAIDINNKTSGDKVLAALSGTVTAVKTDLCYTDINKVTKDITKYTVKPAEEIPSIINTDPSVKRVMGLTDMLGNFVRINHDNKKKNLGYETIYGHLRCGSIKVKVGDKVHAGELLGTIGNSGASAGSHLHFQLKFNGSSKDVQQLRNITVEGIKLLEHKEGEKYKSTNALGLVTEFLSISDLTSLVSNNDFRKLTIKPRNTSAKNIALNEICVYSKVKNYLHNSAVSDAEELLCKDVTYSIPKSQLGEEVKIEIKISGIPELGVGEYIVYPTYSYSKDNLSTSKQDGGKTVAVIFHSDPESYILSPTQIQLDSSVIKEANGGFNNEPYYWKIVEGKDEVFGVWEVQQSGTYEIKAFIPSKNYMTPYATYNIFSGEKMIPVTLTRGNATGQWLSLGTYPLKEGGYVDLHASSAKKDYRIAYNAMLFIKKFELDGFPDVARDDWFYSYADELKRANIIGGIKKNGTKIFAGNNTVTKAEFLKMALRMAYHLEPKKYSALNEDTSSSESWEDKVLREANEHYDDPTLGSYFTEIMNSDYPAHWFFPYILVSITNDFIPPEYFGLGEFNIEWFEPDVAITRYEAIELLSMLIDFNKTFPHASLSCDSTSCKPKTYFFGQNQDDDYFRHLSARTSVKGTFKDDIFQQDGCICNSPYNFLVVKFFANSDIMQGVKKGGKRFFKPNGSLTRAEAAKILSVTRKIYWELH